MEEYNNKAEYIEQAFAAMNCSLSGEQVQAFLRYAELLVQWNEVMNLTAITDFKEIVRKHFVDSCMLLQFPELVKLQQAEKMIDVGTGAGFPGIPLKILCPETELCLLDSLGKRLRFLEEVIRELGLKNVRTVHARAEDGARTREHRERYDLCVSRAVANLSVLSEYCLPYVCCGGQFAAYKSVSGAEELAGAQRAIGLLGGGEVRCRDFLLPGTDIARSLIVIEKKKATPGAYPRKAGTASRNPL